MILKTDLYPYQQDAVDKLIGIRVGALYFEMGTGKTRTALEMIQIRHEQGKVRTVLWLCPCSVKENLRVDLDKHADGWQELIRIEGIESLSSSSRLYSELLSTHFDMVIVDESNLVKNFFAIRTQRITEIGATARYRLILNGTPVSRNEADLYAQWYFLDRRIFGYRSYRSFAANHLEYDDYGRLRRVLNVDYLSEKIAPYSVVIKKEDVLNLPEKYTVKKYFDLTDTQYQHYEKVADDLLFQVDEYKPATIYRFFGGLQGVISGQKILNASTNHFKRQNFFDNPEDNPRVQALLKTLTDEKTIIYCTYHQDIKDIMSVLGDDAVTFYGEDSQKVRNAHLKQFERDKTYLVAMKSCAGYGLNLQYCNRIIYYNNDWDLATRLQSEDRVHRIGQDRTVWITDIVARQTIDMRIVDCLERKENMAEQFKKEIRNARSWIYGKDISEQKRVGCDAAANQVRVQ